VRSVDLVARGAVNTARALRLGRYGLAPGNAGDLLVWDAATVKEALTLRRPPAYVVRAGETLARTTVTSELRVPEPRA
jgi:cytosine/adenosine deaminase-related metal-dependent hydrolase